MPSKHSHRERLANVATVAYLPQPLLDGNF